MTPLAISGVACCGCSVDVPPFAHGMPTEGPFQPLGSVSGYWKVLRYRALWCSQKIINGSWFGVKFLIVMDAASHEIHELESKHELRVELIMHSLLDSYPWLSTDSIWIATGLPAHSVSDLFYFMDDFLISFTLSQISEASPMPCLWRSIDPLWSTHGLLN